MALPKELENSIDRKRIVFLWGLVAINCLIDLFERWGLQNHYFQLKKMACVIHPVVAIVSPVVTKQTITDAALVCSNGGGQASITATLFMLKLSVPLILIPFEIYSAHLKIRSVIINNELCFSLKKEESGVGFIFGGLFFIFVTVIFSRGFDSDLFPVPDMKLLGSVFSNMFLFNNISAMQYATLNVFVFDFVTEKIIRSVCRAASFGSRRRD